jgi:WD40 repeat protein
MAALPKNRIVVRGQYAVDEFVVWDATQMIEVQRLAASWPSQTWAVTPDGRCLITAEERTLHVVDLQTGRELRTLTGHTEPVTYFAATNAQVFSLAQDWTLRVWDIASGSQLRVLEADTAGAWDLAVTPDGRRAISRQAQCVLVWNVADDPSMFSPVAAGAPHAHNLAVSAMAASSAAPFALSASGDRSIALWSIATGTPVSSTDTNAPLVGLALNADGTRAVRASRDGRLTIWVPTEDRQLAVLTGQAGELTAFAATPDFERAVAATSNVLSVWNLRSGVCISAVVLIQPVAGVALASAACAAHWAPQSTSIRILNLDTRQETRVLNGHTQAVCCLAATLDGRTLLSGSLDRSVKVWDLETGQMLKSLSMHGGPVNALAVSPSGDRAVSVSDDQTLKLFDLNTGSTIAAFTADSPLLCCAFASDGKTILAGDVLGNVHVLGSSPVRSSSSAA